MQVSAADAAKTVLEEFEAKLIVLVVYGLQPSASTQNMTAAGNIAQKIKESNPGAKIMMTGTHPAALPYETMKSEAIDFVVDLEGPVTIYKTLMSLKNNGCLLYTSPSPRDLSTSRMPSSA